MDLLVNTMGNKSHVSLLYSAMNENCILIKQIDKKNPKNKNFGSTEYFTPMFLYHIWGACFSFCFMNFLRLGFSV